MTDQNIKQQEKAPSKLPLLIGGLVCIGIAVFLGWGVWQAAHPDPVPLQGMVDAKTISVSSKVPGRLTAVSVREGDTVKAGDIVAEIAIPELEAKLSSVRAKETAAKAQESLAMTGSRVQEKEAAKADVERARAGLVLAQKSFARIDALYKEGLISAQRHDEVKAQLTGARELVAAASAKLSAVMEGARVQQKEAAKALVAQAAGGVSELMSLAGESHVRSPINGEITRVVMDAGEITPPGFPIVMVTDLSDKWVVFNVREDELPGIEKGKQMTAFIPALNKKCPVTVTWINPRGDYATWRATRQNSGYDLRTFEVRARPDADMPALRPGMTVIIER